MVVFANHLIYEVTGPMEQTFTTRRLKTRPIARYAFRSLRELHMGPQSGALEIATLMTFCPH